MRDNWEDILKSKFENLVEPISNDDLATFERKLDTSRDVKRKEQRKLFYGFAFCFAATAVVLFLFLYNGSESIPNNSVVNIVSNIGQDDLVFSSENKIGEGLFDASNNIIKEKAFAKVYSDKSSSASSGTAKLDIIVNPDLASQKNDAIEDTNEDESESGKSDIDNPRKVFEKNNSFDFSEWKTNKTFQKRKNATIITASAGTFTAAALISILPNKSNNTAIIHDTGSSVYTGAAGKLDYAHNMPLVMSMSAQYPINDRLLLNSGINYSLYSSAVNNNNNSWQQSVHYLGIPIRIDYHFIDGKYFAAYAGAGASIDWCLGAYWNGSYIETDIPSLNLNGVCGIQFNISNHFSLFIEPSASWQITTGERNISTWRTSHIVSFSIPFGLRYRIRVKSNK